LSTAVRIRPTTSHDTISIPARFQRTVVQASTPTTVQVDSTTSAPNSAAANGGAQVPPSSAGPTKKQYFTFDQVHPPSTSQHTLFQTTAEPVVSRFLQGFNCTILAYGQTSSGKTYSMTGVDLDGDPSDPNNGMGIIPRSVAKIFEQARQIKQERGTNWTYTLKGSYIEIYNEDLIDLLAEESVKRDVQIREDKDGHIIWGGLREVSVRNAGEVMNLIRQGAAIRRTKETDMNAQSSRSHAIFSLTLTQKKYNGSGQPTRSSSPLPPTGRSPSRLARPGSVYSTGSIPRVSSPTSGRPPTPSFHNAISRGGGLRPGSALGGRISPAPGRDDDDVGEWVTIVSKFHFVDLAGSERLKRTAAVGERVKEGISINSGLLALGNVISALGDPSRAKSHTNTHIPYRDSKLTRLLQDSLGGNANTLMIACVSPAEWNVGETVNTLKYANRARNIRNRAVISEKEDGWDDVEWLQNMVTRLRKDLKSIKEGNVNGTGNTSRDNEQHGRDPVVIQQFVDLQSQHDELRQQFIQRTEELTRLRRELGESQRATGGSIPGTGKYEEIVGPVIEEYEKTIASMEAELNLNRAALRHTNNLVGEKEEELSIVTERHAATELYLEELRARVAKLSEREASTEAYVRDLEEKIKTYDESTSSSSTIVSDLRRELQQYKDRESHNTAYIADLEQRLTRSDEGILSLRERVQQLEDDVESRVQAAELLQKRLDELTSDGQAWRSDLEEREARLRDLEKQLQVWEEKKREAAEERERLDDVAEDVAKARRSLEIDMKATADTSSANEEEQDLKEQFTALQQTHQATLTDLASVTDKYRDALREISDLAAQIQEAKLQSAIAPEPSDDGSDRIPATPRRRPPGGSLRSHRSGEFAIGQNGAGRRSFFRQAASTESLHTRSQSQSQSLSQELSSARSPRPSFNGRPESLHVQSPTLLSPIITRKDSYSSQSSELVAERSAASLEKEIMRLQEVLKEREGEILSLEQSLKEKEIKPSHEITPIPEIDDKEPDMEDPNFKELSPTTLKQFKALRRLSRRLSLQKPEEPPADPSETLDRLNELMLSMAQKESQHREIVEKLNAELNQIRRQHDELNALSRDQLKYTETSTELENQLVSHTNLKTALAELRQREASLLDQIQAEQERHTLELQRLRGEHDQALRSKDIDAQKLLEEAKKVHDVDIARLQLEIANAAAFLARTQQEHEEAFGNLRAEHAAQLEQRSKEVEDFMGQSQSEQAETLSKLQGEHALVLKKEIEASQARLQELRDEHTSMLEKLRTDHEEFIRKKEANAVKALDRLREEHDAAISSLEFSHEGVLSERQSEYAANIRNLQEEHARVLSNQEHEHLEMLDNLKREHDREISDLLENHASTMEKIDTRHTSSLTQLKNELTSEINRLQEELDAVTEEHKALELRHVDELAHAAEKAKDERELAIRDLQNEHRKVLDSQTADHDTVLTQTKTAYDEDHSALTKSHTEEIARLKAEHEAALADASTHAEDIVRFRAEHEIALADANTHAEEIARLRAEHEAALADANNALLSVQEEHSLALEKTRNETEAILAESNEKHAAALSELQSLYAKERETVVKEHELLVQEVAAYKAAMDEFTISRQQTQEAHEEAIIKKDLLVVALEEEANTAKEERTQLAAEIEALKLELENTRSQTAELVQEASKRESLVSDLERHRSLLGEVHSNLQKTKDERDNLASEKMRQEELVRQLQVQLEAQANAKLVEPIPLSPVSPRPGMEHRAGSLTRVNGIPPPMTPPPAGPPPPTPGQVTRVASESIPSRSSATLSASSRGSQAEPSTPATSIMHSSQVAPDSKIFARLEEQNVILEERETMIKTLNKQLTHCEGDLQAHMDLVATLENQLNDSERNLRKARLQATEFSKERDRLNSQVETLRNELSEAKREVVNVRRSIVEEKQSLEHRLDEERKAKERARAQLDQRIEELQKRKSKFACI
ncbi:hypothetical protein M422DRAFT_168492, partial [Sphaerobolus stellatus SS14]